MPQQVLHVMINNCCNQKTHANSLIYSTVQSATTLDSVHQIVNSRAVTFIGLHSSTLIQENLHCLPSGPIKVTALEFTI